MLKAEFLGELGSKLKFRKKALQIIKQVVQFMNIDLLLLLGQLLNDYFKEIWQIIQVQGLDETVVLKYIRNICSVGFKMNNIVPLDQKNFQLFCSFIENYYAIGF